VNAGATDEQIAALPELSNDEHAELRLRAAALHDNCRVQVRQKAKSLASSRRPLTEVIRRIADMAADPPTAAIVDGLLYEEMVVSWVGAGSTFKTFTVLALACCVAAGRDFTHRLRVPEKRPVLVMCAESRRDGLFGDVRAWCEVHGVDIGTLDADGWKDVVQLGDDEQMAELTAYVIERGIKLVVIDTQRKATRGLEENNSTDMGAALANAAKLACEAKAAVVIIHHTGWGREHARGSSVTFDDTDATVLQERTDGGREAEFIITKHKSVATGTRFPVRLEQVTVDRPPAVFNGETAGPGTPIRTLVALSRDPLTTDERSEQVEANLADDDRILVWVVNDNDGQPLLPAEIHRRARERGYERGEDFTRSHLRRLADPASPVITGNHNPVTHRWTYSARTTAAAPSQGRPAG
jgi:hypothetical protein